MEIKNNKLMNVTNEDIINGTFEIPNNIEIIEHYCFDGCTNLQSINLPSSITEIRDKAFKNCTNLQSIIIPDNVTKIGDDAFKECESLKTINLSNNITCIESGAFSNCKKLQSIIIPNNVTKIKNYAFAGCSSLKTINLSDSITKIGYWAFYNCTNLKSIIISNNIIKIKDYAFAGCNSLETINLPNSVTEIGAGAFEACTNLQSINIPNNITKIEKYMFEHCENIKNIKLQRNITEIKEHAFDYCLNLQSLIVECDIQKIENGAFRMCPNLDTIIVSEDTIYTDLNKICEQIQNDNGAKYFNINMNSSLFNIINSISHSYLSIDSRCNYIMEDVIIYNKQINFTKLKNSYKQDIEYTDTTIKQIISNTYIDKIRKKELLDKIKAKLKYNNITNQKYFIYSEHQDIINTIIHNLNNSISYDYRKDLEDYIKDYVESKKTSLITLNTIENNLNNKNILEVTDDLKNYQIKKLNSNEYMELFNFGNDLNIYPLYISTTLHNTVTHFSKDIKIHQIKQKFNELTTSNGKKNFLKNLFFKFDNDNITLNKEILEELNNSINNELTNSENEIKILNELKKLIIIYLKKLEEHIGYLENYNLDFVNLDIIDESDSLLKKNIKNEKMKDLKNIINLTQEKYIQINLIINSNLIYMDKLNNLRVNLLPNLITKIMTDNVIRKDLKNIQEFIEISNTLNEIINSQDNIESNIKNDNFTLDNNEKNKQFYKKL